MVLIYRYHLPFHRPFQVAGTAGSTSDRSGTDSPTGYERSWKHRQGVIVRILTRHYDLVAEAAPLPGFSRETTDEVAERLRKMKPELEDALLTDQPGEALAGLLRHSLPPSIAFAVSALSLQLREEVQQENTTGEGLSATRHARSAGSGRPLMVNGVAGGSSPEEMFASIRSLCKEGYRTIKLKSTSNPQPLIHLIRQAVEEQPDIRFRIDANRSWPYEHTPRWLQLFADLPVDYCEEPCRFETLQQAKNIRDESPVAIALDESLHTLSDVRRALDAEACDLIVLKPTLLGNLYDLLELGESNRKETSSGASADLIVTTALESGVGRMAVARLARLAGSTHHAHGLDTGRMLKHDLIDTGSGPHLSPAQTQLWTPGYSDCDGRLLTPLPTESR